MGTVGSPGKPFEAITATINIEGGIDVCAKLCSRVKIENSRACLALNASNKIKLYYGVSDVASPLGGPPQNYVEPVARRMIEVLAGQTDDKTVDAIYWECGKDGAQIEPIGRLSAADAGRTSFTGPAGVGMGTSNSCVMLPAVKHFQEGVLKDALWGVGVFVTDALIDDLAQVKEYTRQLAREINAGERHFVKLVVIGVTQCLPEKGGAEAMKKQLVELDDSLVGSGLKDPHGDEIDVWLHAMVATMTDVGDAFATVIKEVAAIRDEFAGRTSMVYDSGKVVVPKRKGVVQDYSDGVPGLLRFTLPPKTRSFALECPEGTFTQQIPVEALDELVF